MIFRFAIFAATLTLAAPGVVQNPQPAPPASPDRPGHATERTIAAAGKSGASGYA